MGENTVRRLSLDKVWQRYLKQPLSPPLFSKSMTCLTLSNHAKFKVQRSACCDAYKTWRWRKIFWDGHSLIEAITTHGFTHLALLAEQKLLLKLLQWTARRPLHHTGTCFQTSQMITIHLALLGGGGGGTVAPNRFFMKGVGLSPFLIYSV